MISLLATVVILAVMSVIAVKSLDGLPTSAKGKGAQSAVLPGVVPIVVGGPTAANNDGVQSAGPSALIAQTGDTVAQANLDSALTVVDQVAASVGGYGEVTIASMAGQVRGQPFIAGPSTTASQMSFAAAGGGDGGVTLAVRSASGTCWYAWRSNSATWYGAETGRAACIAPALASAPSATTANSGSIEWQDGAFPRS